MNVRKYDNISQLNKVLSKMGSSLMARGELFTRFRKIVGKVPVCAEYVFDCAVFQFPDDVEILTTYRFFFTVFRCRRRNGKAWMQAVACFDIHDHDLDQEWPVERQEIGERLRKAGIAYVVFPTTHVEDLTYLRCPDFKRRIRRAVFSDRPVKFRSYPSLPVKPKRTPKAKPCRSNASSSETTASTRTPASNSNPASTAS